MKKGFRAPTNGEGATSGGPTETWPDRRSWVSSIAQASGVGGTGASFTVGARERERDGGASRGFGRGDSSTCAQYQDLPVQLAETDGLSDGYDSERAGSWWLGVTGGSETDRGGPAGGDGPFPVERTSGSRGDRAWSGDRYARRCFSSVSRKS